MDGVYVAHQGKISGWVTYKMFCKYKNTGKFPALIYLMMKLMGVTLEEMMGGMEKGLYLGGSDESVKRNFMENYTYYTHPDISNTKAKYIFGVVAKSLTILNHIKYSKNI